jgi:hypothetical protein
MRQIVYKLNSLIPEEIKIVEKEKIRKNFRVGIFIKQHMGHRLRRCWSIRLMWWCGGIYQGQAGHP